MSSNAARKLHSYIKSERMQTKRHQHCDVRCLRVIDSALRSRQCFSLGTHVNTLRRDMFGNTVRLSQWVCGETVVRDKAAMTRGRCLFVFFLRHQVNNSTCSSTQTTLTCGRRRIYPAWAVLIIFHHARCFFVLHCLRCVCPVRVFHLLFGPSHCALAMRLRGAVFLVHLQC